VVEAHCEDHWPGLGGVGRAAELTHALGALTQQGSVIHQSYGKQGVKGALSNYWVQGDKGQGRSDLQAAEGGKTVVHGQGLLRTCV